MVSKIPSMVKTWQNDSGRRLFAVVLAIVTFAGSLALFTRHHDFPYYYHPDEMGKVNQVLTHTRNYNHPLLLLSLTQASETIAPGEKSPQAAVIRGRWVSACLAAAAVALLAFVAARLHGLGAGLVVALVLGSNRLLFQLAHYFKEDTALLFGVAFAVLALYAAPRLPALSAAALLGLASALAISGKFAGVILVLPLAAVAVFGKTSKPARWPWRLLAFGAVFFAAWGLINYNVFADPSAALASLRKETIGMAEGQGLPRKVPHAFYLDALAAFLPTPLLILAAVGAAFIVWKWRECTLVERLVPLIAIGFFVFLSFSPLAALRYSLPLNALCAFIAALGAWQLLAHLTRQIRGGLVSVLVPTLLIPAIALPSQWDDLHEDLKDFARDDRGALIEWIRENISPNARIAQDARAALPTPERQWIHAHHAPLPHALLTKEFVADFGTLEELIAQDIDYVVICEESYQRFVSGARRPLASRADAFSRRKHFYHSLLDAGPPIWKSKRSRIFYLRPGLQVYRLHDALEITQQN